MIKPQVAAATPRIVVTTFLLSEPRPLYRVETIFFQRS
jgi:hypothetical protein